MSEPFGTSPNREEGPERRQLVRSTNDRMIAGVCAGVADYINVQPNVVRLAMVVAALSTSLTVPVLIGYLVASQALPEGSTTNAPLSVDWQATSMRVTWRGPIAPYVVPWSHLVLGFLIGFFGLAAAAGIAAPIARSMGDLGMIIPTFFSMVALPLGVIALLYALTPRTWALTLSEGALWIERPTRRPERIPLDQIEAFHPHSQPFTIHLKDGDLVELAPPPLGPELDVVVDELRRSIDRAADHEAAMAEAEDDRYRLAELARRAAAEAEDAKRRN